MPEPEERQEEVVEEAPKVDLQVEERAKMQGWVPKEEFRGDQGRWISADEFVKRADHMMPILKSVNKKLETQLSTVNQKLADTQTMIEKMVKVNEKYTDDFYDTKISDLKVQKKKAAQDGDWDTYDRLEIQETKMSKPEKLEIKPSAPTVTHMASDEAEVNKWKDKNKSWYGVDHELTDYAVFLGEQLRVQQSPLAAPGNAYAFCEDIERKLKATFPTKFSNPNRNRSEVDESGLRGGDGFESGAGKTWKDLPADARAHANKLIQNIPGYTKEKYLKDYFEGA